jgi:lipopolysaccharide biosynthesis glycosyltransferase
MDCDMLCLADIKELWDQRDDRYAVMVKKHEHVPTEDTKFLGQEQTKYGRKNWSSLMLMNCSKLTMLTKHIVNTQHHGLWFHQLQFVPDDQIGEIQGDWNLLVDYDPYKPDPKLVHYTSGGPWHGYWDVDYTSEWKDQLYSLLQGDNPVEYLEHEKA